MESSFPTETVYSEMKKKISTYCHLFVVGTTSDHEAYKILNGFTQCATVSILRYQDQQLSLSVEYPNKLEYVGMVEAFQQLNLAFGMRERERS